MAALDHKDIASAMALNYICVGEKSAPGVQYYSECFGLVLLLFWGERQQEKDYGTITQGPDD